MCMDTVDIIEQVLSKKTESIDRILRDYSRNAFSNM